MKLRARTRDTLIKSRLLLAVIERNVGDTWDCIQYCDKVVPLITGIRIMRAVESWSNDHNIWQYPSKPEKMLACFLLRI